MWERAKNTQTQHLFCGNPNRGSNWIEVIFRHSSLWIDSKSFLTHLRSLASIPLYSCHQNVGWFETEGSLHWALGNATKTKKISHNCSESFSTDWNNEINWYLNTDSCVLFARMLCFNNCLLMNRIFSRFCCRCW